MSQTEADAVYMCDIWMEHGPTGWAIEFPEFKDDKDLKTWVINRVLVEQQMAREEEEHKERMQQLLVSSDQLLRGIQCRILK